MPNCAATTTRWENSKSSKSRRRYSVGPKGAALVIRFLLHSAAQKAQPVAYDRLRVANHKRAC